MNAKDNRTALVRNIESVIRPHLFPLLQCDRGSYLLAVTQDGDLYNVANFTAPQGVGEIVEILDGFVAKLNEDISGQEAGFGGGRAGLHIGKAHAVFGLAEIGDGAEVRAVATAAAGRARMGIGILHNGDERGTIGSGVEAQGHVGDQIKQVRGRISVDFFPGVRRLVVVAVETREKEKHGNAFGNERSVIAGGVATGGVFVLEGGVGFGLVKDGLKSGAGAEAADVNIAVFDAADHVHVEHRDGLVEWPRGIFDPFGRAEEPELFAGEVREENTALELALERSEEPGKFQDAGSAGGVVIRSGMDLANL